MAGIALKVKTKTEQQILNNLTQETTVKELKTILSTISKIPENRLMVLSGYPPKSIDISQDGVKLKDTQIKSGDILILEEKPEEQQPSKTQPQQSKSQPQPFKSQPTPVDYRAHVLEPTENCPGILMKQVVPADNSCLFSSIHFVLNGKVEDSSVVAPSMRQIIAETVAKDLINYSEAILGKPNDEYCAWILDNNSWGGAIELAVLSNYFGVEIAVVDTINAIINRFGEDQSYAHRVFLMFDGIHYDPLYLEPLDGSKIQTIFPSDDERVLRDAEQLAIEAKSSRQYTDVNKFTLKCMICNVMLKGQLQAQQHASSTGHMNFGEV
ncbi:unnamed protein product [Brassicogethes aeneus]|uniref:Ubiquitin thioesterase OTU n=1 Tax=Brassicogethes aeneus TaxID=1431903 RepID=A0A9P0FKL9_BRAAE|nr:unnamed protein product [Brassicogethes aeneus]